MKMGIEIDNHITSVCYGSQGWSYYQNSRENREDFVFKYLLWNVPVTKETDVSKEKLNMIDLAFRKFAKDAFGDNIFKNNNTGLRVDLSESGSTKKAMLKKYNKSNEVLDELFKESGKLSICLTFWGTSFLSNLYSFRQLKKCGVNIPQKYEILSEHNPDDGISKFYLFFDLNKTEIHKLIWGGLGADFGKEPSIFFGLYFFDVSSGILAHPYDSRGIDIVGTNRYKIKAIYKKFYNWLSAYNIQKKDMYYKYC